MKNLIIILSTLSLVSAFAWADTDQEAATGHDNEAVDVNQAFKIIPQTHTEEDPALYAAFDVSYPQMVGKPVSLAAQIFNNTAKQRVDEEVIKFKNSLKRDLSHMKTLPETVRHNSFHLDYDIDVIHPGPTAVISVRFNIEGMQAGRAHPFHRHSVINFDFGQNKLLQLSDVFKPHTKYLRVLAAYSAKKLHEPLAVDKGETPKEMMQLREQMIKEGSEPKENNYKLWNIEADGLLITFEEYQVAPYVNGTTEVEIPFSAMKGLLSTKTSLAPCIKNDSHCVEKR